MAEFTLFQIFSGEDFETIIILLETEQGQLVAACGGGGSSRGFRQMSFCPRERLGRDTHVAAEGMAPSD